MSSIKNYIIVAACCISFGCAFSAPKTATFLMSHMTPEFVAAAAISFKIMKLIAAYMRQHESTIRIVEKWYIPIMLIVDTTTLITAIYVVDMPEIRYVLSNIILCAGIPMMKLVYKNNICNVLEGTEIVLFQAKIDTFELALSIMASAIYIMVTTSIDMSVQTVMILESVFCAFGHWMMWYANKQMNQMRKNK